MRVLLIEDEEHKANDLKSRLLGVGILVEDLVMVSGVRQAVLEATKTMFDLVVLDMALPTFAKNSEDSKGGGGGGIAQAVGGVEVLRALEMIKCSTNIIIVTQYPEIVIGSSKVKIQQAAKIISKKYSQNVIGAVLYSYKTPEWGATFDGAVKRVKDSGARKRK